MISPRPTASVRGDGNKNGLFLLIRLIKWALGKQPIIDSQTFGRKRSELYDNIVAKISDIAERHSGIQNETVRFKRIRRDYCKLASSRSPM